ncbi:MAG: porin family protein [Candidatus Edwardsbacteria bacterium]|nr:porin family protein [Candidatus Edwardsbacteria bacterium]
MLPKKISTYLAVMIAGLALLPRPAAAQSLSLGLWGNLNGAKFVRNPNTNASINEKIGLGGGGYVNYRINRLVSFRSGILFNQKGAEVVQAFRQTDTTTGITYDHYNTSDTRLNYAEVPVVMCFSLARSHQPLLNLYFGVYGARLVSGRQVTTASASAGIIQMDSVYIISESAFRKDDYGLVMGGNIPLGRMELGGSFSLGFPRIVRPEIDDINRYVDHRNRVLSFTVGYRIKQI